ncbi:Pleckstrin homology domain-containing family G member 1 [Bagarius yarrelli]|uniref:Pleckstrin homology domain-containing family G member 1 n=1 Tax=Bagarius yarrelli TaxID=175774 RepID=A0A556VBM8_BAGYA|nr:Pleckstrin homology domain-containing family G member 1 [Bagarius yarrelli]
MDSAQCNGRPVSYTSTSSSASSSRDSHCSAVLGSVSERDRDSGAIRLELIPARQLEEAEPPAPASQNEERKVAYVDHVVQEILETERTYVQDLQSIVQGPDLIGYGELVLEGTFRVQRVKNDRTFFLFDKLLLITKKREETYAYKAHILAKSQQDKRTWIQHLKRLILENHPAKIPAKTSVALKAKTESTLKKVLPPEEHAGRQRSSFGATLLSPVVHLGTIGRSRSLVSQSQESLDHCDHGDHSDLDEGSHPQDADDEDDGGLGSGGKLRVPGKSIRKRLNAQVSVDSIDQWKNRSLDHIDLQTAKESLQKETKHTPVLRVTCSPETRASDDFSQMLGTSSGHSVPNIWADHRVRRAMFPTRQKTVQIDDDEDIYQMFVPTENDTSGQDAESDHDIIEDRPGRPCSWHVEQTQSGQLDLPASRGKVYAGRVVLENKKASNRVSQRELSSTRKYTIIQSPRVMRYPDLPQQNS